MRSRRQVVFFLCVGVLLGCQQLWPNHRVGGTVTGLVGSGLVLRSSLGDELAIAGDGAFTFPTAAPAGSAFAVTVQSQPTDPWQTCAVSGGPWTIQDEDLTVSVSCSTDVHGIGGEARGVLGDGLALTLGGGAPLAVPVDGPFTFPSPVESGLPYQVAIASVPPTEACTLEGAFGTVAGADVTDVRVTCACGTGRADCDGDVANGCERDLASDPTSCGSCGAVCAVAHGTPGCALGACAIAACDEGYHVCSAACVSSSSTETCGAACTPCAPPAHASATCDGTRCGYVCDEGWARCPAGCCQVEQVAAGSGSVACAVLTDRTVMCWGAGESGQLGDGSFGSSPVPVPVAGLADAVQVAVGGAHVCARTAAGEVRCWGANDAGQLGTGDTAPSAVPVDPGLTGVTAIAAGLAHTCAAQGTALRCWGLNDRGQVLPAGAAPYYPTPQDTGVVGSAPFTSVAASDGDSYAASGGILAWGDDQHGQAGNGTVGPTVGPVPVLASPGTVLQAPVVVAGGASACALAPSGRLTCWGTLLGVGRDSASVGTVPVSAREVSVGAGHACAVEIYASAAVRCWGANGAGQLGNGLGGSSGSPVVVQGVAPASHVAAGCGFSCAVVQGAVRCWGANGHGELGDGLTAPRASPAPVVFPR